MNKVFNPVSNNKLESEARYKLIPPKSVLDIMGIKQGDALLEIGTGTGYFALPALDYVKDCGKVIGTDISPAMLIFSSRSSTKSHKILSCI